MSNDRESLRILVVGALIKAKHTIYGAQHEAETSRLKREETVAYADSQSTPAAQAELAEAEVLAALAQLKVKRSHLYGVRYSNAFPPNCISCFVESGAVVVMDDTGLSAFRCAACGASISF